MIIIDRLQKCKLWVLFFIICYKLIMYVYIDDDGILYLRRQKYKFAPSRFISGCNYPLNHCFSDVTDHVILELKHLL